MAALDAIVTRHGLNPTFVRKVKQLAASGDINEILAHACPRL
jgi:hypothetical protein